MAYNTLFGSKESVTCLLSVFMWYYKGEGDWESTWGKEAHHITDAGDQDLSVQTSHYAAVIGCLSFALKPKLQPTNKCTHHRRCFMFKTAHFYSFSLANLALLFQIKTRRWTMLDTLNAPVWKWWHLDLLIINTQWPFTELWLESWCEMILARIRLIKLWSQWVWDIFMR